MRALKVIGKILLAIVSFVLCVALFASSLVTMLVADVKVATNKDNLENILNQTLSTPTKQVSMQPLNAAAGTDVTVGISSGSLSDVLVGFAFDSIQEMMGGEAVLELEQVKQFVEKSTFKDFISSKSASIISDIYTGEKTTTITSDEIVGLLEENKELMKEYFNVEIPAEQLGELYIDVGEVGDEKTREDRRGRYAVGKAVICGRFHGGGGDLLADLEIVARDVRLDGDGAEKNDDRQSAEHGRNGRDDLFYGGFAELEADEHDDHGDDQSRHVFNSAVTEGMVLVGLLSRHAEADERDDG